MCSFRNQARSIAGRLPEHARLAIIEPETSGKFSNIVHFELSLRHDVEIVCRGYHTQQHSQAVREYRAYERDNIDAIYVQKAKQVPVQIMGFKNDANPVFLLREGREWKQVPP